MSFEALEALFEERQRKVSTYLQKKYHGQDMDIWQALTVDRRG